MIPAPARPVQTCTRCIMDTSDPEIAFDDDGVCSHCRRVDALFVGKRWFPHDGRPRLDAIVARIKEDGRGKDYDCVIGLSGGVDSSYLAWVVVRELGLRPLAIHVDAGWNSEIAVHNIEQIVRKLDIDLYTEVVDWQEVQDLQRAYFRAGVANQDVPQDHVFFAVLYELTVRKKIGYFLTGGNFATESILPSAWGYNASDATNLNAIHKAFGERPLKTYKRMSFFRNYVLYPYVHKLQRIRPLDYLPYERDAAIAFIERELGWKNYGDKHHESRWTRWFQAHYLPVKFGFDKRRAHLSSMVVAGEITREEALKRMEEPLYDPEKLKIDEDFVIKKLGISENEFRSIMAAPPRHYSDFANEEWVYRLKDRMRRIIRRK